MEESKKDLKSVPLTIKPNNNLHKKLLVTSKPTIKVNSGKQKQNIYRIQHSSVLDQVKNFLPQLISSNEELLSMDESEKEKYDIENIDQCEKVIEMNISVVDNDSLLSDDSNTDSDKSDEEINLNNNSNNLKGKITTISLVQELSEK